MSNGSKLSLGFIVLWYISDCVKPYEIINDEYCLVILMNGVCFYWHEIFCICYIEQTNI